MTAGLTPTEQPTRDVSYSCSLTADSWVNRLLTLVLFPYWDTGEKDARISALTAEKSGGVWYLHIQIEAKPSSAWCKFPANDIQINGRSLDRYLEDIATKDTSIIYPQKL